MELYLMSEAVSYERGCFLWGLFLMSEVAQYLSTVGVQGPTAQAKLGGGGDSDQSTAVTPFTLYPTP